MNRVLVTGGAGFIGSQLSEALLKRGDSVVAYDNFDPYYDPALKRRNIESLLSCPQYSLVEADILDSDTLAKTIREFGITKIVHLAARAGVRPSLEEPAFYQNVNVVGTTNVLEVARRAGIKSLAIASSSSVYGGSTRVPFKEDDPADFPVSPYAASKRATELVAHTYCHLYGMDILCLRLFTVYGPRQRTDMAISKFVNNVRQGKPIDVYGDGTSLRDYTFIDDIVSGILAALDHAEGLGYQVFNLGNSKTVELGELISIIGEALGITPIVRPMPNQPGDVPQTYACIDKARQILGFEPKTSIREGIARYVKWLESASNTNKVVHKPHKNGNGQSSHNGDGVYVDDQELLPTNQVLS